MSIYKPHVIFRRKQCQVEMMISRGYTVPDEELVAISSEKSFKKYYENIGNNLNMNYKKKIAGETLTTGVVYYINTESVRSTKGFENTTAKRINKLYKEEGVKHIILISNVKVNDLLEDLPYINFEIFDYNFFRINPTRHKKSQKTRIYTDQEKQDFYNTNKFESWEMPGDSKHNPVVKYYGAKVKDLMFIERSPILTLVIDKAYYFREVRDIPIVSSGVTAEDNEDDAGEEIGDGNEIAPDHDEIIGE